MKFMYNFHSHLTAALEHIKSLLCVNKGMCLLDKVGQRSAGAVDSPIENSVKLHL